VNPCRIGPVEIGTGKLVILAGPCLAESGEMCRQVAETMAEICEALELGYVFKASYDKANRSSLTSYRSAGMDTALDWIAQAGRAGRCPVLTDVHETGEVESAAQVADCLQIPAFLCRQTDLLVAAGASGKAVNIKKGQFMAPWDMGNVVEKVTAQDNPNVLLTDRGTSFGYNRLVTDYRGLIQMRRFAPVCFDATHSTQEPGGLGSASGGQRQFAPALAAAAMAVGADALFIETHPDPANARSDAACQIPLDEMPAVLQRCKAFYETARSLPE
jgi:2-dehydro-3-deoxyphosphooctonate aldolase (KDO 8-P synthase)